MGMFKEDRNPNVVEVRKVDRTFANFSEAEKLVAVRLMTQDKILVKDAVLRVNEIMSDPGFANFLADLIYREAAKKVVK